MSMERMDKERRKPGKNRLSTWDSAVLLLLELFCYYFIVWYRCLETSTLKRSEGFNNLGPVQQRGMTMTGRDADCLDFGMGLWGFWARIPDLVGRARHRRGRVPAFLLRDRSAYIFTTTQLCNFVRSALFIRRPISDPLAVV
jgi:hypothetical protein